MEITSLVRRGMSGIRPNRRSVLKALAGGAAGISLPGLLAARDAQRAADHSGPDTAVIFVYLGGGATQFETFDPKPEATVEYRGAFGAIDTAVPGMRFCELAPKLAQQAERLSIVRSVHHEEASHIALHYVETGYRLRNSANALKGESPAVGSVASKMRSPGLRDLPAFVSLPKAFAYSGPQWLGGAHQAFGVDADPSAKDFSVKGLALSPGLTEARLVARRKLWAQADRAELVDASGSVEAAGEFTQRAFDLLLGERAQRAFDLGDEASTTRDAYGRHAYGQRMLLARRLVEAGVPFVAVRMADWDDHQGLAARMKTRMPQFDGATAALIEDLHERGLQRRVLVVTMGEFGRTPKVNGGGGRDHWPGANSVLLAGGNLWMGQVIGATDKRGGAPIAAPYRPEHVLTMVYRHLGIDPGTTFFDHTGRPRHVLELREPIAELV